MHVRFPSSSCTPPQATSCSTCPPSAACSAGRIRNICIWTCGGDTKHGKIAAIWPAGLHGAHITKHPKRCAKVRQMQNTMVLSLVRYSCFATAKESGGPRHASPYTHLGGHSPPTCAVLLAVSHSTSCAWSPCAWCAHAASVRAVCRRPAVPPSWCSRSVRRTRAAEQKWHAGTSCSCWRCFIG